MVVWTPVSGPSTAPAWNETFLERTDSPDEFIVPSCKGLSQLKCFEDKRSWAARVQ